MNFTQAWELMKQGKKVKREHWGGYWSLENGEIIIHGRDGQITNIRDNISTIGTFSNIAADDWLLVEEPKKLFISQPMAGKTDKEILEEREHAVGMAKKLVNGDVDVIDSVLDLPKGTKPLEYLAKSIELLAKADVAYFAEGWDKARGCKIEHECAVKYGIKLIIE